MFSLSAARRCLLVSVSHPQSPRAKTARGCWRAAFSRLDRQPLSSLKDCRRSIATASASSSPDAAAPSGGERTKLATVAPRTFRESDLHPRVGIVTNGRVYPFFDEPASSGPFRSMLDVMRLWPSLRNTNGSGSFKPAGSFGSGVVVGTGTLMAPILRPGSVICIGKNYLEHVGEVDSNLPGISRESVPEVPIIFNKSGSSVVGPDAAVELPVGLSQTPDYEGELGVVVGLRGRFIPKERALEHVFGYTIVNDCTARDVQKRHQQWFLGKSVDTFCPVGPVIVPADELDASDLAIQTYVNGELRQSSRTKMMMTDVPALIALLSSVITLHPGDVLATGTPKGVGAGFTPPKYLRHGDELRVLIEGIGELRNPVKDIPLSYQRGERAPVLESLKAYKGEDLETQIDVLLAKAKEDAKRKPEDQDTASTPPESKKKKKTAHK